VHEGKSFFFSSDVMNKMMLGKKRKKLIGVSQQQPEDLDFADDICILSHTFNKMYM
jgi:hypothetical protein